MHGMVLRRDRLRPQLMLNPYFKHFFMISELLTSGRGYCFRGFMGVYRIHRGGVYSSLDDLSRSVLCARIRRDCEGVSECSGAC